MEIASLARRCVAPNFTGYIDLMSIPSHPSITACEEFALVKHLIADWHWGEPIRRAIRGPEECLFYPEVPRAELGEGDIDVLAVNPIRPYEAVAIQVKRVKVQPSSFATGMPNKLNELKKLALQANQDARLGFWRVCACVIVLVDSREENQGSGGWRVESNAELDSTIEASVASLQLLPSVELLHIELEQPVDDVPFSTGYISCSTKRLAREQAQSPTVTEWVSRVVEARRLLTGPHSGLPIGK